MGMNSGIDLVFKGFFLYGFLIFLVIFLITALITRSFSAAGKFWGTIFGVLFVGFTIFFLVDAIKRKNQLSNEKKQFEEFVAHSKGYFDERCKSAGLFIYDKKIPPQESVYMMRDVKTSEYEEYRRNYFIFQGLFDSTYSLLLRSPIGGPYDDASSRTRFSYIEAFNTYQPEKGLFRTENVYTDEKQYKGNEKKIDTKISEITSRYGATWEDLTTSEDFEHSLVGGRIQIIELKTNKVVAEKINYILDNETIYRFSSNQRWEGWNPCISGDQSMSSDDFILNVLRNPKLLNKG